MLPALAVDHTRVTELHHALHDKPVIANKVVCGVSGAAGHGAGGSPRWGAGSVLACPAQFGGRPTRAA